MSNGYLKESAHSDILDNLDTRVLDAMPDWVRVINNQGLIIYANKSMISDTGINPVGINCFTGIDSINEDKIPSAVSNHHMDFTNELKEERDIGDRTFSIQSSPLFDKVGEFLGKVEVFRDITRDKKVKIELIEANKKLFDDVIFASKIQEKTLPKEGRHGGLCINHKYIPSGVLSGDTFDVIDFDEDNTIIYIADVVGHGVSASIITMYVRQSLKTITQNGFISPKEVLEELTIRVDDLELSSDKYITMFYGVYNKSKKEFAYSSAGHNGYPIIYSNDCYDFIKASGFPVSVIFKDMPRKEGIIKLNQGDKILFYTDGIIETENHIREEYGEERLLNFIKKNEELEKKDLLNELVREVDRFRWDEQKDDIALLLAEVV